MICRHCGTDIADRALICYKCGSSTTEPRVKPPADGPLFSRPQRVQRPMAAIALALMSLVAALAVFLVVQDRVTAEGARRYVALQRSAIAGRTPFVTIDEVVRPAVDRSVRQGALWGGLVLLVGLGAAVAMARRRR